MNRRGFLQGIGAFLAAPAIVSFGNLMPVRGIVMPIEPVWPPYLANRMVMADFIIPRALMILENSLLLLPERV